MERCLVYFFATEFDRVKTGVTKGNLYQRQQQIQIGCPDPIHLLGIIRCADQDEMTNLESTIKILFRRYNTSGEWFELAPEIEVYIQEFTENGHGILEEDKRQYREYDRKRPRNRDHNYRERQKKKQRERYANDPEFRKYKQKQSRKHKQKLRTNPDYRESENRRRRERRAQKRQQASPEQLSFDL